MFKNKDWPLVDLGVSTEEAIKAFQVLGQSLEQYEINEELLKQLKTSTSTISPMADMGSVEFVPSMDTIAKLEVRVAELEKLVDELRTKAVEKAENPNQNDDLEIFESNAPEEDENIFSLCDLFHKPIQINWNDIKLQSEEELPW